ncbi:hypothetical protein U14_05453 [Candidatus Moduliflexus flocculans]|uniref:Orc1-like AAA ATPase domain-containing protein n=1 Tax=Candidatus Moduliflexus flocculans TaxID=1499966 RepID=A0A081BRZ3_9BACT|nr:hypothetical protein U14_05453 [Candidatus Moduliflexus flocculans]
MQNLYAVKSNRKTRPAAPALFVNRDSAKQEFLTALSSDAPTFLEFYGVAGQGKTELLKWIAANPSDAAYVAAYADFEVARFYQSSLSHIVETIIAQLAAQMGEEIFSKTQERLRIYREQAAIAYAAALPSVIEPPEILEECERAILRVFHEELQPILTWRTFVLCLDSLEKAYRPALRRLEDAIILPHVKHPHFFLVTAAQERSIWTNPAIRQQFRGILLRNFELKHIKEQVEQLARVKQIVINENERVFTNIQRLTAGHPYCTYKLVKIASREFTAPLAPFEQRQAVIVQELVEHVVKRRLLARTCLDAAYPPACEILWHLSPLRQIELGVLQRVLAHVLPEVFDGKPLNAFERLIGAFQASSMFTKWQLDSGFVIDPAARSVLLWDMRLNAPQRFVDTTAMLANLYREKIEKTHEATQVKNIIEWLYHHALYLKVTAPHYVTEEIKEGFASCLTRHFTRDRIDDETARREQIDRLRHGLEYDDELEQLVEKNDLFRMLEPYIADAHDSRA